LLEHADDGATVTSVVRSMKAHFDSTIPQGRVGPWRLIRRPGHGGQGAVFEAARDDGGFEQRAAIK